MSERSDIRGFNLFYDFCWYMFDRITVYEGEVTKLRAADIFRILGEGDPEKGYATVKNWHAEFQKQDSPTAQIHLFGKWRQLSDQQRIELARAIEDFNPPHKTRPSESA